MRSTRWRSWARAWPIPTEECRRSVSPRLNAYYIGQLIYFFEIGCGISGNVLGVNPFNQPGVEAYKKNMFALLDKPGYEAESKAIQERLSQEA